MAKFSSAITPHSFPKKVTWEKVQLLIAKNSAEKIASENASKKVVEKTAQFSFSEMRRKKSTDIFPDFQKKKKKIGIFENCNLCF
jgi:hypothetical protein